MLVRNEIEISGSLELKKVNPNESPSLDVELGLQEAETAGLPAQEEVYRTMARLPERLLQIFEKGYLEIINLVGQDLDEPIISPENYGFIGTREVSSRVPIWSKFPIVAREVKRTYQAYDASKYDMAMPPDILRAYTVAHDTGVFDRMEIWEIDNDPYLIGVIENLTNRYDVDRFFLIGSWDETSFMP